MQVGTQALQSRLGMGFGADLAFVGILMILLVAGQYFYHKKIIICKTGISEPIEILKKLLPWLKQKGYETTIDSDIASFIDVAGCPRSQIPAQSDMIIVMGGDGTMLSWLTRSDGQWVSWVAPLADPVGRELCRGCAVVDFFDNRREVLVERDNALYRRTLDDGAESPALELEGRVLLDEDLSADERWLVEDTLESFGISAKVVHYERGPAVTRYLP